MAKETMKAVVFHGKLDVRVEDRPVPKIVDQTDIIIKVRYSALCGSELHVFRGHQPSKTGFIMGHETTGEIVELGSEVKNHKKGDRVVMPFTASCGECFYCIRGYSSRCEKCVLFGCPLLDGGQAEYMRVPLADSTAVKAPEGIEEKKLVLMADIFPTGYFAAKNAFEGFSANGRGADCVIEGVGHADALRTGFDLLRPFGNISSFGVHQDEIPWTGTEGYGKNLKIQMGRCPVRSVFPHALEVLKKNQHKLDFMTDKIMPMSQAIEGYDIFNKMQVHKVIFEPEH
ncbi:Alcohol dehydrogenase superfamily zinc-type protein [Rutstroemia sp. NJR-2017a BVV2]|nr:Alcohol dehydrogenase superfamily zinc-type protein [Rutstroemia sp. NJR-2017a BVV2]